MAFPASLLFALLLLPPLAVAAPTTTGPGSRSDAFQAEAAPDSAAPDASADDLGASTEPAWVPARPVPPAEPIEAALRLPGRLVSLPLSGLGYVTRHTMIVVEDRQFIPRVLYVAAVLPRLGVAVAPASLGDRSGLGVKVKLALPRLRDHLSAEWDGSTGKYSRTRLTAGYGPLRAEYGYDWRPRDRFFGIGLDTSDDDPTAYATQSQHGLLHLGWRTPTPEARWRIEAGGWAGPREIITRRGSGDPSFVERFPELTPALDRRVEHFVYGGSLGLDNRRGKPHWGQGGRLSVRAERYDDPIEAFALRTTAKSYRLTRLTYEAEGGFSFFRDPRTFRLLLRAVVQRHDGESLLPLYDFAGLGGSRGLAGFEPGRFHDLDAAVGKLSYIFPIANRFEMDLHAEAGGVYGDLWEDASLASLETSYGVALRPRVDDLILGAVGVDWSRETLRLRFSIGGVE